MSCWVVVIRNRVIGTVRKMPFAINLSKEDVHKIAQHDCSEHEIVFNIRESEENECFTDMSSPINILRNKND